MSKRIPELDGLRAVAILLVFGVHYPAFAALGGGETRFGWIGVDIFFALSGYLITSILLRLRGQQRAYATFYSRRTIRIFPPFLLATLPVVVLGILGHARFPHLFVVKQALFLQAVRREDFAFVLDVVRHLRWYALHPPSLLLHARDLKPAQAGLTAGLFSPADSYWSLSVEEYFYVLWAPVVLHFSRRTVGYVGLSVCIVEVLLRWFRADMSAYFGLCFRMDALIYGAFLALLLESQRDGTARHAVRNWLVLLLAVSSAGLAAICAVLSPIIGREVRQSPLMLSFGLTFISIASSCLVGLLVLGAKSGTWFGRLMRARLLQYLGTISYSLYLWHLFAYFAVRHALGDRLGRMTVWADAVLSIALTILIARASWHYVEKPLLRWKDRRFPGSRVAEPRLN